MRMLRVEDDSPSHGPADRLQADRIDEGVAPPRQAVDPERAAHQVANAGLLIQLITLGEDLDLQLGQAARDQPSSQRGLDRFEQDPEMATASGALEVASYSPGAELLPGVLQLLEAIVSVGIEHHPAHGIVRGEGVEPRGDVAQQVGPDHLMSERSAL